jgi:ubiquinone/menaquinone biosynthesis C-methylase UbiE
VEPHPPVRVERRPVDEHESRVANQRDWDAYADEYQSTHGTFLGDVGFVWGPEGLGEEHLGLLGEVIGKRILEVGSGANQCSRWLMSHGAWAVGLDLSHRQLQHARRIDDETGLRVPAVNATATQLPFAAGSFDTVFSSFGALQFVSDIEVAVGEVARVLVPGGRFAFSITHPTRWMFPDDPTAAGLVASQSYWDRTPYVEIDDTTGQVAYVEHHRTIGDWVRILAASGFVLTDIAEPQWPAGHQRIWGGWSHIRGVITPGTAIYVADLA